MSFEKFGLNSQITQTGVVGIYDVAGLDRVRFATEGAGAGSIITLKARLEGQANFTLLATLTGETNEIVKVFTYDELQVEIVAFNAPAIAFKLLATGYYPNPGASGVSSINTPNGNLGDPDNIAFTSTDLSVDITADPLTNTIDFTVSPAVAGNAFGTVSTPAGTNPVADNSSDTLSLTSTDGNFVITGNAGSDTVNFNLAANVSISGSLTVPVIINDLTIEDKLITLNNGGAAVSGGVSGFQIEENAVNTGYLKTSVDRNSFDLKVPNQAGIVQVSPGAAGFVLNQGSHDAVTVSDTNSIDLTLANQDLSANLSLSNEVADIGNLLINNTIVASGLKSQVLISSITSVIDATYVNVNGDNMSGNLVLDDEKELRLSEATGNGINYIGLKAPANLASSVTFTLPIDGSANQLLKTDGSSNLSFGDIQRTQVLYVDDTLGLDVTGAGTINSPYKTIQKAVDILNASLGGLILVAPGNYTEELITINSKDNVTIEGYGLEDSHLVCIKGKILVSGTSTRFRLKQVQLDYSQAGVQPNLEIVGTNGRHYISSVAFTRTAPATGTVNVSLDGSYQRWSDFRECSFSGSIVCQGSPLSTAIIQMMDCDSAPAAGVPTLSMLDTNYTARVFNNRRIGYIDHQAGSLSIQNSMTFGHDGANSAIVSTASNASTNNRLVIKSCNFQLENLSAYYRINKTGNCVYVVGECNRDIANDTLTGIRQNYSEFSEDIAYNPTTSANWNTSPTNVVQAFDELAGRAEILAGPVILVDNSVTQILTYPKTNYFAKLTYSFQRDNAFRVGRFLVVTDGTDISYETDHVQLLSEAGITLEAIISGANVIIRAALTSTSQNGSLKYYLSKWS